MSGEGRAYGMPGPAARRWAELQSGRGIPPEILAGAPADPWRHDPRDFAAPAEPADTPSRDAALALLDAGGTLIDVGCGGGDATFAVAHRLRHATGVDRQQDMLDLYAADATARGLAHRTVRGGWPEVAAEAGTADVVVCHHVLHNVVDLPPFLAALSTAARRGVVVEMLTQHPMAWLDPLWERFHGLRRPPPATDDEAVAVLAELGICAEVRRWERDRTPPHDPAWVTRRLCLPAERAADVEAALAGTAPRSKWAATLTWRS
ncbi:MAG TPA: class I SAM-dependent methyltransferase [Pseudonocardia sp.]|nr:class I SAM-dependent methyltransferase [Pseudonocardia sp.]